MELRFNTATLSVDLDCAGVCDSMHLLRALTNFVDELENYENVNLTIVSVGDSDSTDSDSTDSDFVNTDDADTDDW